MKVINISTIDIILSLMERHIRQHRKNNGSISMDSRKHVFNILNIPCKGR